MGPKSAEDTSPSESGSMLRQFETVLMRMPFRAYLGPTLPREQFVEPGKRKTTA